VTDTDLIAYRVSQLERRIVEQALELAAIEARNAARDAERNRTERKQLIAGIMFLGGIIMSLGGVIWAYRGVIFRGNSG
jgi:hypothetical protein